VATNDGARLLIAVLFAVSGAACAAKAKPASSASSASWPAPPDGMWQLAPDGAVVGVVMAPGTLDRLYRSAIEIDRVLSARPWLNQHYQNALAQLRQNVPFEPLDAQAARAWGLDAGRGLALFFDADTNLLLVSLPFTSAAVLTKFGGAASREGGRTVYREGELVCIDTAEQVLCGRTLEAVDAALTSDGGPLARRVGALHGANRGDIEVAVDLPAWAAARGMGQDLAGILSDVGLAAAAVRVADGVVRVTASIEGALQRPFIDPARSVPPAFAGLDQGAVGLVRAHLAMPAILAELPLPPSLSLFGFDVHRDLIDQLTGDVALVTRGRGALASLVMVGLRDSEPLRKALPLLCRLAAAQLRSYATITVEQGSCLATPIFEEVGAAYGPLVAAAGLRARIDVQTGMLRIFFGDVDAAPPAGGPPVSPHLAPLLADDVQIAGIARLLDPFAAAPPEIRAPVLAAMVHGGLSEDAAQVIDSVRWVLAHIAEIGVGGRVGATHQQWSLVLTTYAADPQPIYAAYQAAVVRDLDGDVSGYFAALKGLAARPDTMAGRHARLVELGAPMLGPWLGVIAVTAIPAFVRYHQAAREMHAIEPDEPESSTEPDPPVNRR
jgi:hypothetical protein